MNLVPCAKCKTPLLQVGVEGPFDTAIDVDGKSYCGRHVPGGAKAAAPAKKPRTVQTYARREAALTAWHLKTGGRDWYEVIQEVVSRASAEVDKSEPTPISWWLLQRYVPNVGWRFFLVERDVAERWLAGGWGMQLLEAPSLADTVPAAPGGLDVNFGVERAANDTGVTKANGQPWVYRKKAAPGSAPRAKKLTADQQAFLAKLAADGLVPPASLTSRGV